MVFIKSSNHYNNNSSNNTSKMKSQINLFFILLLFILIILGVTNSSSSNNSNGKKPKSSPNTNDTYLVDKGDRLVLPNYILPKVYSIHLNTKNIESFKFTGEEEIVLDIKSKTKTIVIHSSDLEIQSAEILNSKAISIQYNVGEEIAILKFKKELPVSVNATLKLKFSGIINDQGRGFYRSIYRDSVTDSDRLIYSTQMESSDARRVFPCFDEPIYKAIFNVKLTVDKNLSAISNNIEKSIDVNKKDKTKTYTFEATPKMSTYLVAFIIGDLEYIEGYTNIDKTRVRVYKGRGISESGELALQVAIQTLDFFVDYFNISLPFKHLQLAAIPNFSFYAMENYLLLVFDDIYLLKSDKATLVNNKELVDMIAHEVSHQWFGNLVTISWWNSIWLNEGFAEFFGYYASANLYPEWNVWLEFSQNLYNRALYLDSLTSTHPVELVVRETSQLAEIFYDICYDKGASIVQMIQSRIGPENFKNALRYYLKKYSYQNTVTENLWDALSLYSNGLNISEFVDNYIKYPGYPILSITPVSHNSYSISQKRFTFDIGSSSSYNGSNDNIIWNCFIIFKTEFGQFNFTLDKQSDVFTVPNEIQAFNSTIDWIKPNYGQTQFYRIEYNGRLLDSLVPKIKSLELPAVDRLGILSDVFSATKATLTPVSEFMDLVFDAFKSNEVNGDVWKYLIESVQEIEGLIFDQDYKDYFTQSFIDLLSDISNLLGFDPIENEDASITILRGIVNSKLALLKYEPIITIAKQRYQLFKQNSTSLNPDIAKVVFTSVLNNGSIIEQNEIVNLYLSTSDIAEKKLYLEVLSFSAPTLELFNNMLEFSLNSSVVQTNDIHLLWTSYRAEFKLHAFNFFVEHFTRIDSLFRDSMLYPWLTSNLFCNKLTPSQLSQIETFFLDNPVPMAQSSIQSDLENIIYNINCSLGLYTKNKSISLNRKLNNIIEDQNNNSAKDGKLKVFLIPHSHCDGGWLKTYDEYFYEQVQYILDGVTSELDSDSQKKFNWAEIGFFSKWYDNQNQTTKNTIYRLINNGQLEFVGGGWVQNDEATANLDDVIEQVTKGHQWLKDTLNYTVNYAWQIDPFGYSSLTPSIFSRMGFKGMVINRVSKDLIAYMKDHQEMELLWQGSKSLGIKSEMLISVLDNHYSYPKMVDPVKSSGSASSKAKKFVQYLKQLAKTRNSNTLIVTLGDDFKYTNAAKEFGLSKEWLTYIQDRKEEYNIEYINYSTLSEYFNQLKQDIQQNDIQLTQVQDDFYPYSTGSQEYWSGYYTSRPSIKKQIRDVSYLLRVTDSLYSIYQMQFSNSSGFTTGLPFDQKNQLELDLDYVRSVVSLTQHHDIVTGTSRSYVLYDFFLQLKNARVLSLNIISNLYNILLNNSNYKSNNISSTSHISNAKETDAENSDSSAADENSYLLKNFINLNDLDTNESYSIKLFNSLGWEVNQHISIRLQSYDIKTLARVKVLDSELNEMAIQINALDYLNPCFNLSQYSLFTVAKVPAFGFTTLYLTIIEDSGSILDIQTGQKMEKLESDLAFGNDLYEWKFSKSNGLLKSLKNITGNEDGEEISVSQNFQQYKSKKSGPYIFEAGKMESILTEPDYYIIYDGALVSQLSLVYNSGNCKELSIVNQRVYKSSSLSINQQFLETSYSFIGNMNREKVIQYKIDSVSNSNREYYTDNGLESKKRIINDGSTSSNYYPTLHYTHLKDESKNQQFTVFVDRSVGSTLKSTNQIEIMLHRTSDHDDSKGISWPSKDTSRIDGKLYFNFDSIGNQMKYQKKLSLQIDYKPFYLVKRISNIQEYLVEFKQSFSPLLLKDLPDNIHLLSLKSIINSNSSSTSSSSIGLRLIKFNNNSLSIDNQLSLNSYLNSFSNYVLYEKDLAFLDLVSDDSIDKEIKGNYFTDKNLPIKSGISEYDYSQNQNQNDINSNNTITINPLEVKSYTFKLNNKNNSQIPSTTTTTTTTIISYQNLYIVTDDSIGEPSNVTNDIYTSINYIYTYDFSVYPLELSHYNDRGNYPSKLKIILLSTIIPGVIIIALLIGFIVYKMKQRSKKSLNSPYSQNIKFSKIHSDTNNLTENNI